MGTKRNEGLHGSTDMRAKSRVRVLEIAVGESGVTDSQSSYNYFFMARCTV